MNRTERVREILRLEGLAAAARDRAGEYRAALDEEARAELTREGSAPSWRLPDIGTVALPLSKEAAVISDIGALLKWCKERHPSEVEQIEQVRTSFQSALLSTVTVAGEFVVHTATGEIVPGMSVRPGGVPKSLTITTSRDAKAVFAAAGAQLLEEILAPAENADGAL